MGRGSGGGIRVSRKQTVGKGPRRSESERMLGATPGDTRGGVYVRGEWGMEQPRTRGAAKNLEGVNRTTRGNSGAREKDGVEMRKARRGRRRGAERLDWRLPGARKLEPRLGRATDASPASPAPLFTSTEKRTQKRTARAPKRRAPRRRRSALGEGDDQTAGRGARARLEMAREQRKRKRGMSEPFSAVQTREKCVAYVSRFYIKYPLR